MTGSIYRRQPTFDVHNWLCCSSTSCCFFCWSIAGLSSITRLVLFKFCLGEGKVKASTIFVSYFVNLPFCPYFTWSHIKRLQEWTSDVDQKFAYTCVPFWCASLNWLTIVDNYGILFQAIFLLSWENPYLCRACFHFANSQHGSTQSGSPEDLSISS